VHGRGEASHTASINRKQQGWDQKVSQEVRPKPLFYRIRYEPFSRRLRRRSPVNKINHKGRKGPHGGVVTTQSLRVTHALWWSRTIFIGRFVEPKGSIGTNPFGSKWTMGKEQRKTKAPMKLVCVLSPNRSASWFSVVFVPLLFSAVGGPWTLWRLLRPWSQKNFSSLMANFPALSPAISIGILNRWASTRGIKFLPKRSMAPSSSRILSANQSKEFCVGSGHKHHPDPSGQRIFQSCR